MRSNKPLTMTLASLLISMALTGCGKPEAPLLTLTTQDRTPVADPAKPNLPQPLPPPQPTGEAERKYLWEAMIAPLMDTSLKQEATTQQERQRANGVVAKVDAAQKPKRPWWRIR